MAILKFDQVTAPDFTGVSSILNNASSTLDKAGESTKQLIKDFNQSRSDEATFRLRNSLYGLTPEQYDLAGKRFLLDQNNQELFRRLNADSYEKISALAEKYRNDLLGKYVGNINTDLDNQIRNQGYENLPQMFSNSPEQAQRFENLPIEVQQSLVEKRPELKNYKLSKDYDSINPKAEFTVPLPKEKPTEDSNSNTKASEIIQQKTDESSKTSLDSTTQKLTKKYSTDVLFKAQKALELLEYTNRDSLPPISLMYNVVEVSPYKFIANPLKDPQVYAAANDILTLNTLEKENVESKKIILDNINATPVKLMTPENDPEYFRSFSPKEMELISQDPKILPFIQDYYKKTKDFPGILHLFRDAVSLSSSPEEIYSNLQILNSDPIYESNSEATQLIDSVKPKEDAKTSTITTDSNNTNTNNNNTNNNNNKSIVINADTLLDSSSKASEYLRNAVQTANTIRDNVIRNGAKEFAKYGLTSKAIKDAYSLDAPSGAVPIGQSIDNIVTAIKGKVPDKDEDLIEDNTELRVRVNKLLTLGREKGIPSSLLEAVIINTISESPWVIQKLSDKTVNIEDAKSFKAFVDNFDKISDSLRLLDQDIKKATDGANLVKSFADKVGAAQIEFSKSSHLPGKQRSISNKVNNYLTEFADNQYLIKDLVSFK